MRNRPTPRLGELRARNARCGELGQGSDAISVDVDADADADADDQRTDAGQVCAVLIVDANAPRALEIRQQCVGHRAFGADQPRGLPRWGDGLVPSAAVSSPTSSTRLRQARQGA